MRHHEVVRAQLKRHAGREIDTAGDGFFATFEQPATAVECARDIVLAVRGLGLTLRAAVHTGEVELAGRSVSGIAVHLASRLLSVAAADEVVVSGTVHDLVSGSGLDFLDRGVHELKSVPGSWHVYALVLPTPEASTIRAQDLVESRTSPGSGGADQWPSSS